jgi:hypothetical protein
MVPTQCGPIGRPPGGAGPLCGHLQGLDQGRCIRGREDVADRNGLRTDFTLATAED